MLVNIALFVGADAFPQAKAGFLGFGAQPAKVQVTYEAPDPAPEAPRAALSSASRSKPKTKPAAPKKAPVYTEGMARDSREEAVRDAELYLHLGYEEQMIEEAIDEIDEDLADVEEYLDEECDCDDDCDCGCCDCDDAE